MPEHKVTIRVASNGVVVERFNDHVSVELWVYMGTAAPHSAALCVQGMLEKSGEGEDHSCNETAVGRIVRDEAKS